MEPDNSLKSTARHGCRTHCAAAARAARHLAWCVGAIALFALPGCTPIQSAHRILYNDFREFPPVTDARQSCRIYRHWAQHEWQQLESESGESPSGAYKSGFLDGFVDAVYAGGNGEPPVVPPRRFWRVIFRNSAGDNYLADWTRGFRHGARIALDGGYRQRALVPSLQSLENQSIGPAPLLDSPPPPLIATPELAEPLDLPLPIPGPGAFDREAPAP